MKIHDCAPQGQLCEVFEKIMITVRWLCEVECHRDGLEQKTVFGSNKKV